MDGSGYANRSQGLAVQTPDEATPARLRISCPEDTCEGPESSLRDWSLLASSPPRLLRGIYRWILRSCVACWYGPQNSVGHATRRAIGHRGREHRADRPSFDQSPELGTRNSAGAGIGDFTSPRTSPHRCPKCRSEEIYAATRPGEFAVRDRQLGWLVQCLFCERCIHWFYRPGRLFVLRKPIIRPPDEILYDA